MPFSFLIDSSLLLVCPIACEHSPLLSVVIRIGAKVLGWTVRGILVRSPPRPSPSVGLARRDPSAPTRLDLSQLALFDYII
jgi:hypothetical protein